MRSAKHYVQITATLAISASILAACATAQASQPAAQQPTAAPVPTLLPPTPLPTSAAGAGSLPVSGTGSVRAARTSSLSFMAAGLVQQVLVKEGDAVKQGDLLATLDPRPFDSAIAQAEADVAAATAAKSALSESPNAADVQVANANVQAAQVQVRRATNRDEQGVTAASSGVEVAKNNLQAARDELSRSKTQAEARMQQATLLLTQAQAAYSQAKAEWEYVQETGKAPQLSSNVTADVNANIPHVAQGDVGTIDPKVGKLNDTSKKAYYNRYVSAEAALGQAEEAVHQTQVDFDTARQQEVTGVQSAEQQVTQAQAALNLALVPDDATQKAEAEAVLAAAQGARNRLNPSPRASSKAVAEANLSRAQAALDEAKLAREYAEIRAPFDGTVTAINLHQGEVAGPLPSVTTSQTELPTVQQSIELIDASVLRFEVPVDETDIGKLRVGQRATVVLDALADTPLDGTISYIAATAQQNVKVRTYLVRVDLSAPGNARDGMSGQLYIPAKK